MPKTSKTTIADGIDSVGKGLNSIGKGIDSTGKGLDSIGKGADSIGGGFKHFGNMIQENTMKAVVGLGLAIILGSVISLTKR